MRHTCRPKRIGITKTTRSGNHYRKVVGAVCECGEVFNAKGNRATIGTKRYWQTVRTNRLRKKLEKARAA